MLLNEIFTKPAEYEKDGDIYRFRTKDGQKIRMNVYHIDNMRMVGLGTESSGIGFDFTNETHGGTQDITGSGSAIEIFSTVITIIKSIIDEHDPELIAFGAHEKSRQKLYRRIIKSLQKEYNYTLLDNPPVLFPLGDSEYYVLVKK